MLTRLKVSGFKNLFDVDLSFGLFTCIAGHNGVGKSNLFDVIRFLSDLASMPLRDAATRVRGVPAKSTALAGIFGPAVDADGVQRIRFEVEAVVPPYVKDDYGQDVSVRCTFMVYELTLKLIPAGTGGEFGDRIEIEKESLAPRSAAFAKTGWRFAGHKALERFVVGKKRNPLIESLTDENGTTRIWLRSDRTQVEGENLRAGAPTRVPLTTPRTVLSSVDSAVHASHLGMKREMQSWRLLQLEPSALREPDGYQSETRITERGEHLPSAFRRVAAAGEVALDVSNLIRGVSSIEVVNNDVLQLRTLNVRIRGKAFPASALSDGTLRFLALSILASDPDASGLICMEEPENGIHPTKVEEMVALVRRLADDPAELEQLPLGHGIRQIIINTHSPLVVSAIEEPGDVLFAGAVSSVAGSSVEFLPVADTWRAHGSKRTVAPGSVRHFVGNWRVAERWLGLTSRPADGAALGAAQHRLSLGD